MIVGICAMGAGQRPGWVTTASPKPLSSERPCSEDVEAAGAAGELLLVRTAASHRRGCGGCGRAGGQLAGEARREGVVSS